MDEERFKERTKGLALRVIRLVGALPSGPVADVIGRQLLRSATSVGANYIRNRKSKIQNDLR